MRQARIRRVLKKGQEKLKRTNAFDLLTEFLLDKIHSNAANHTFQLSEVLAGSPVRFRLASDI
jgi:hypothetical protein